MGSGSPGPGLYCYSLIGKIDNGTPFQLGSSASFTASVSGRLYLGVNDNVFSDNSGSWQANSIVTIPFLSSNYAGYAATGTQNNSLVYSDLTATWIVPTVSCSISTLENSKSATWAGLGDNVTDLEQVGTESNCFDGVPQYLAVWQVYQNGQTQGSQQLCIPAINCVNGGDKVKAEVKFISLGQFQVTLWDLSTNNQWSIGVSGDTSSNATALGECIEEEPQGATLSNFGTVRITCQANPNNTFSLPIGLAGDIIQKYLMSLPFRKAKTGTLNTKGTDDTFSVVWVHA